METQTTEEKQFEEAKKDVGQMFGRIDKETIKSEKKAKEKAVKTGQIIKK